MHTIVVVSGGFDPIHSGHINMIREAKKLGSKLIVAINSDEWLVRKKGQAFMPLDERAAIVSELKHVDELELGFNDSNGTCCDALIRIRSRYPTSHIIFANGGDRGKNNVPEMGVAGVECVFGVGGENKANSSSWLLQEWKAPKTERPWGYYRVLHEVPGCKVKELTVDPGKSLSMQKHNSRSEFWMVTSGKCAVDMCLPSGYCMPAKTLETHDQHWVPEGEWHKLSNPFKHPCKIVEIQYGESCTEEDIERQ